MHYKAYYGKYDELCVLLKLLSKNFFLLFFKLVFDLPKSFHHSSAP